jgi:hypothetical protein
MNKLSFFEKLCFCLWGKGVVPASMSGPWGGRPIFFTFLLELLLFWFVRTSERVLYGHEGPVVTVVTSVTRQAPNVAAAMSVAVVVSLFNRQPHVKLVVLLGINLLCTVVSSVLFKMMFVFVSWDLITDEENVPATLVSSFVRELDAFCWLECVLSVLVSYWAVFVPVWFRGFAAKRGLIGFVCALFFGGLFCSIAVHVSQDPSPVFTIWRNSRSEGGALKWAEGDVVVKPQEVSSRILEEVERELFSYKGGGSQESRELNAAALKFVSGVKPPKNVVLFVMESVSSKHVLGQTKCGFDSNWAPELCRMHDSAREQILFSNTLTTSPGSWSAQLVLSSGGYLQVCLIRQDCFCLFCLKIGF